MKSSATNELGKHPSKKVKRSCWKKPTTKGYDSRGLMETSQNMR